MGISRQAVVARVHEGKLAVLFKPDTVNGAYLFDPEVIDDAPGRYQR